MANFRRAIAVLSLLAAAVAEAPYNLPRPGPGQPSFNLPGGPGPQQLFNPSSGYNYQQPAIGFGQSGFGNSLGQSSFGQSGIGGSFGQSGFGAGANFGLSVPPSPPSTSYGLPQINNPQPFRDPRLSSQSSSFSFGQNSLPQGQFGQAGFNQQSGLSGQFQAGGSQQFLNRPGQSFGNGFQDSSFFNQGGFGGLDLGGVLDSTVVGRVQNIITQNEQNDARLSGYQSLVRGIQFGQPRPGIEIAAFSQNGPIGPSPFINGQQGFSSGSFGTSGLSNGGFTNGGFSGSNIIGGSSQFDKGFNFLPNQKPAAVYGSPAKKK